jgi:hypothetical protein
VATIRQRKGKWQVQIRHQGLPAQTRTFHRRADAIRWSKQTEVEMDRHGLAPDRSVLRKLTLGDLLRRFRDEVCPHRRGGTIDSVILTAFLRSELADRRLEAVTPEGFAAYRDQRLKSVRPATLNRELGLVQRVLEVARREWGIPLSSNPVKAISKPTADNARERRLS